MHDNQLKISIGQLSDKGQKSVNQDFYGVQTPKNSLLSAKGIAIAIADGISSSQVSQVASETAVKSFLDDYYCTSESWSVKNSAKRVLLATNSWLYAQNQQLPYRFDKNKGYVCTFSGLILKATAAYILHIGDSRIYRLRGNSLEQLTEDHRTVVSHEKSYLSRALGIIENPEIDYQSFPIEINDVFILATDGLYEFVGQDYIIQTLHQHKLHLDLAAKIILEEAIRKKSDDNLTLQIVKVDQLPKYDEKEVYRQITQLPFPPKLEARMEFDGYKILRDVYISTRSYVYLALDNETQQQVILKLPSIEFREDTQYLERFLFEEWVAKRINNEHVLKPCLQTRKRNYLYIATEFIEGKTLRQWILDNPQPDIEVVRNIIEQIAKGLQAFHRQEMLHQDLRPNNIMIDPTGTVKIIDFGATRVAGIMESIDPFSRTKILGTAQYTAPEYFLGEAGSIQSDQFSLAVITYQMLSGRLPYGVKVSQTRTKAQQRNLRYQSALDEKRAIPAWVDYALKKALQTDPHKRYPEISEFIHDLRQPNTLFLSQTRAPLIERNPVGFWKGVAFILSLIIIYLANYILSQ